VQEGFAAGKATEAGETQATCSGEKEGTPPSLVTEPAEGTEKDGKDAEEKGQNQYSGHSSLSQRIRERRKTRERCRDFPIHAKRRSTSQLQFLSSS